LRTDIAKEFFSSCFSTACLNMVLYISPFVYLLINKMMVLNVKNDICLMLQAQC